MLTRDRVLFVGLLAAHVGWVGHTAGVKVAASMAVGLALAFYLGMGWLEVRCEACGQVQR